MELLYILHMRLFGNKSKFVDFETREPIIIFWTIKWPQMKKIINYKILRSRQNLQFWYKTCLRGDRMKRLLIFFQENNCRGGSDRHPPLEMYF